MSVRVVFALIAWGMLDLTLLLALVGAATHGDPMEPPWGNRILATMAVLTVFFGVNAYAIDSFGRYLGF
ncbi:hypothetical protein [Methylorubrum suomiense]|uniref:Uncharacterized protein n=1 Tax=Methylorubrum suomiense TaxID=144191 RepID=A0ABQ4V137_9HYPH|nr:hypothetical protein [Methylorubrum suomiense]GJE78153.1 hypothetical protein BGCPKDLD_4764 [Methylorubrum suomiense]